MTKIISLITDFGLSDHFVGTLKGTILNINPEVKIVDITHEIKSHDIFEAAFAIKCSYNYFPPQTIHLIVVDPGVGSKRRPIIATTDKYIFIAPDNGVLSFIYEDETFNRVLEITAKHYFLKNISSTFHGRDIFSPIAAWLSRGVNIDHFGKEIKDYLKLDLPKPAALENRIEGEIIHIDRFGNLISNISKEFFEKIKDKSGKDKFEINFHHLNIHKIGNYFAEVEEGQPCALFGSTNFLEICLNKKNASQILRAGKKDKVWIIFK